MSHSIFWQPVIVTAALALTAHPAAAQAGGELHYQSCIGTGRSCGAPRGGNPLAPPARVAITPDGNSAYVLSSGYDAYEDTWAYARVSHLRLAPFTAPPMSYAGCVGNPGVDGLYSGAGASAMLGLVDVAALDASLYTLSHEGDLVHFRRAPDGDLTYAGCIGQTAHGCFDPGVNVLAPGAAIRIAASRDARNLYVLSAVGYGEAIAVLDRLSTGDLVYAGCIGDGVPGCTPIGPHVFARYTGLITASSDAASNNLYVLASDGTLSRFWRAGDGSLYFSDCIGAVPGCAAPPVNGLGINLVSAANDLRSAHDGATLFVLRDHSLSRLDRLSDGTIAFSGCVGTHTSAVFGADNSAVGCATVGAPDDVFAGLRTLDLADDGSGALYTIASAGAVAELSEWSGYQRCWGNGTGCTALGEPLQNGLGLAVTSLVAVAIGTPVSAGFAGSGDGTAYAFTRTAN